MPDSFISAIRDLDAFLQLGPEELGGMVILYLNALPTNDQQQLNRHNFLNYWGTHGCPTEKRGELENALAEAWTWLERECLVALRPNAGGSQGYFITRRGRALVDQNAVQAFQKISALPRFLLHPRIEARVYPSFLRGAYDTAVFEAFREVEVAVRDAAGFGPERYGKQLMRDAFSPTSGPLTDKTAPKSEQESVSDLFAGASGLYKNPSSHRVNTVSDPHEAAELIIMASHLLKLAESRKP
jgi:uncharacterized protein (TIGR02391 family)